ncbi:MAG: hypothetical protein JJ908_01185 [Rhizobiales bacterium]|nr:hypothetical protein [Hyphomicrobiales bacterium]MBO6698785.1 hypothetical protein [Hyphomicrobiales bacterium]MBO6734962.1 hypothetical protein [Hyphomicrobiales bacterium]MBO6911232.1 hypothetical protein [Hyphomicrobiales bacterium]MBO6955764.1 hypothetical protein [Hyphomicrobiales bacterium]
MTVKTANDVTEDTQPCSVGWDRLAALLGRICAFFVWLLALSWRSDADALAKIDEQLAAGKPVIAVFWHSSYLALFALAAGRPVTVFTSRSFRGKVIAGICRRFGYDPYLLPPGRQGYHDMRHVLLEKTRDANRPVLVGIAIDGPLGPRHAVKLGALHMAARMAAALMPIRVTSRPVWAITSRWDHFKIPLPFAKVRLDVGPAMAVPNGFGRNPAQIEALRKQVHDRLNGQG